MNFLQNEKYFLKKVSLVQHTMVFADLERAMLVQSHVQYVKASLPTKLYLLSSNHKVHHPTADNPMGQ
jgi:hypothetical protein